MAVVALLTAGGLILWEISHREQRKGALAGRKSFGFWGKQGRCGALGFFAVFFAAFMIVMYRPAYFYDLVYQAEGKAFRAIRLFSGENENLAESGEISRGNNHRTGAVKLEVMLSEAPSQAIYLKGFCGGIYKGDYWEEADDEALFEETGRILGW